MNDYCCGWDCQVADARKMGRSRAVEQRNSRRLRDRAALVSDNASLSEIQSRRRRELMGKTALDVYEAWDLSKVAMPFFFNDTATTEIYTLSLHDALPI